VDAPAGSYMLRCHGYDSLTAAERIGDIKI
jgi:hypothetical protein